MFWDQSETVSLIMNAILGVYFSLILWRVYRDSDKILQHNSLLLDTVCHVALLLFLFATITLLRDEQMNIRISLSTALSALCACLVSLIFGISLGRSWGLAEAKIEQNRSSISDKKRVIKSKANQAQVENLVPIPLPVLKNPIPSTIIGEDSDLQEIYEAAELAKSNLLSILDINTKNRNENPKQWKIARSGYSSHTWTCATKTSNNLLLKGSCFSSLSVASVAKHLYQQNISTGLEGIMKEKEVLLSLRRGRVIVSRMMCSLGGTLTHSKREFYLVTYWAEMENGSIVICSRSLPDTYQPHAHHKSSGKPVSRGFIYSCGFIIMPTHLALSSTAMLSSPESRKKGCQVLYCVEMDFCSSSIGMRRQNNTKSDSILNYILELMDSINSITPDPNIDSSLILSPGTLLDHAMGCLETTTVKHVQGVIQGISQQHRSELKNISKDSINRLLMLHMSSVTLSHSSGILTGASIASKEYSEISERKWTTFYDQDGIVISEYCGTESPVGTLMASCHVNASPQMIKKLLVEFPEYVDTLLEKRNILCQLDESTMVQWIAYGAIWPVGATDFLVVTTECAFNSNNPGCKNPLEIHDSFLIVSTSVDSIIEDEEEKNENDEIENETKYNRSTLRLAGYSGTPNTLKGGTDLRLFVDVDATRYVPAWLLQILAQYGLSEMMNRIRIAAPTLTNSEDHSPIFQPASSKLGVILTQIQSREEKMRQFVEEHQLESSNFRRERQDSNAASTSQSVQLSSTSPAAPVEGNREIEKGVQLAAESQHILKLYAGIIKDEKYLFDWQVKTKKSNIEVSVSPVNGSVWFALKATTTIPHVTKYKLKDFLVNDANLSGYDDMMDSIQPLLRVNEKTAIRRIAFKAIWPTAPRDFLVCTTWNELEDGAILISSRSAWSDLYPSQEGYVRGFLNISGYYITPCKDSEIGCDITMCAHSDLGGTLPTGIINMLAFAAPVKMLAAISALTRE